MPSVNISPPTQRRSLEKGPYVRTNKPPIPNIPVEEVDYDGKEKVYSNENGGLAPRAFRHIRKKEEDS